MRERRLLPCAGAHNLLLHIFTSLKCKRRFLKEAKHFYREDAKTAKMQKISGFRARCVSGPSASPATLFLLSGGCKSAGTGMLKQKNLPRNDTEFHRNKNKQKQKISAGILISFGARLKGSNGGVAVGLPHRNSSVFNQTPYRLIGSKRKNKNGTPHTRS
jgi:hypothetical protein